MSNKREIINGEACCGSCKEWKPIEDFPKNKSDPLGIYIIIVEFVQTNVQEITTRKLELKVKRVGISTEKHIDQATTKEFMA